MGAASTTSSPSASKSRTSHSSPGVAGGSCALGEEVDVEEKSTGAGPRVAGAKASSGRARTGLWRGMTSKSEETPVGSSGKVERKME